MRGSGHLRTGLAALLALAAMALLSACDPSDRRPGLWLSGEEATQWPADWSFSNAEREIYLQVSTPYLLPHSITIWCAEVDGDLYVAAARAAEKRWPGWVDDDPDVKLKVAGKVYTARLAPLDVAGEDSDLLTALRAAYQAKYNLGDAGPFDGSTRYWRVTPAG